MCEARKISLIRSDPRSLKAQPSPNTSGPDLTMKKIFSKSVSHEKGSWTKTIRRDWEGARTESRVLIRRRKQHPLWIRRGGKLP